MNSFLYGRLKCASWMIRYRARTHDCPFKESLLLLLTTAAAAAERGACGGGGGFTKKHHLPEIPISRYVLITF